MTLAELKRAAREGVREAQYVLGFLLENGLGCVADRTEAETWYRKAAEQGLAAAQYELAMTERSCTTDEQFGAALIWVRKAAEGGFWPAQMTLSAWHEGGFGMPADPVESFRVALKAAEDGYVSAAREVASMYERGRGVAIDLEKAFAWSMRAAELGDPDSAYAVGRNLQSGSGVAKDEQKALTWLVKACDLGSPWGCTALSHAYRFGELGLPVDEKKAEEYAARAKELLKARAPEFNNLK